MTHDDIKAIEEKFSKIWYCLYPFTKIRIYSDLVLNYIHIDVCFLLHGKVTSTTRVIPIMDYNEFGDFVIDNALKDISNDYCKGYFLGR